MNTVEDFVEHLEGNQKEIVRYLHLLLTKNLNLQEKIRYKIPFYYGKSWICYLNPIKGDQIELAFLRGNELSNDQKILDFKQRKQVSGKIFSTISEITDSPILEVLHEAILLDQSIPYELKRK
jgi:hypothetical protein